MRYTFADSSASYDEILALHILDFLTLMNDPALASSPVTCIVIMSDAVYSPSVVRPCRLSMPVQRLSLISSANTCRLYYQNSTAKLLSSQSSSVPSRWVPGSIRLTTALMLVKRHTRRYTLWYEPDFVPIFIGLTVSGCIVGYLPRKA